MIQGFATPEGTERYAQKYAQLDYGELDQTGLLVSQGGFGCYRVDAGVVPHIQALKRALLSGVNLIDTSSNYADGGSETLVGAVLKDLILSGELSRESVVVVSKVGYLQGRNFQLSQERKQKGQPFKELVMYAEGLEHCIHPEFLEDQLSRTLERLKLAGLDCYLLHNPEYYLSWANKTGLSLDEAREKYYDRLSRAFSHLETEVERGRIRFYGISSNTFPSPATDPEFTSLERIWEVAESISTQHHFRVIQLPMNLLETGGASEKNQAGEKSVIQFAQDKRLGVLINRPLNAILKNRLVRLAEVESRQAASAEQISRMIEELISSEDLLTHQVLPTLNLEPSQQTQLEELIGVGTILQNHWQRFGTHERWQELQSYYFIPRFRGAIQVLMRGEEISKEIFVKVESYQEKFEAVFRAITSVYQQAAAEQSAQIKAGVSSADPDWAEAETLSQMAVRALRSTPGITTVLIGMRYEHYVEDVLAELGRPVERQDRTASWRRLRNIGE